MGIPARTSPPQVTPDFAMAAVTMSMAAVTPALVGANKSAFKGTRVAAAKPAKAAVVASQPLKVSANLKELRDRIDSVSSTQKITTAMKLVAAAKVRRAQDAVINARPFSENLVKVLFAVNSRLAGEDVDVPLAAVRPVKSVMLLVCTGDRGLCGGFNNFVIKKAEERVAELEKMGIAVKLVCVGKKAAKYFESPMRSQYTVAASFDMGNAPTTAEAQAVADQVYSEFVSEDSDKVELVYTKFISLIKGNPTIQTLLPLAIEGQVCDINGNCVDATNDEIFKLTSKDGEFAVEREAYETEVASFDGSIVFEQDPNQILDALLPLYMNSQVLRAFQESVASELAARMNAMSNASDNAKELKKSLSLSYNRKRQAKITGELIELVAGAAN